MSRIPVHGCRGVYTPDRIVLPKVGNETLVFLKQAVLCPVASQVSVSVPVTGTHLYQLRPPETGTVSRRHHLWATEVRPGRSGSGTIGGSNLRCTTVLPPTTSESS